MDHTMGKTESMTFKIERNYGLYDKADNIIILIARTNTEL